MGYDDYSYSQVYATWQAELREQAATDALARRIRRDQRAERRAEARRSQSAAATTHETVDSCGVHAASDPSTVDTFGKGAGVS